MASSGLYLGTNCMVDYDEPDLWPSPSWHPDFGDVQGELEHLRYLANQVVEQAPQLSVGLSVPEVGLMFLVISHDRKVFAEIYSIQSKGANNKRKYGLFLHPNSSAEEEHYASDTRDVMEFLKSGAYVGEG